MENIKSAKLLIRNFFLTILGILILAYFAYQIYNMNPQSIKTEMVVLHNVADTINTDLFILRNEKVLNSTSDGVIVNVVGDAQRVPSGGDVAYIFDTSQDAQNFTKGEQIDEKLKYLNGLLTQESVYTVSHDSVDKSIVNTINSIEQSIIDSNYSKILTLKNQLLDQINERQLITSTLTTENVKDKIADLTSQKNSITYSSYKTIKVDEAGTFVGTADGFENVYDYDNVLNITVSEIDELFSATAGDTETKFGKIITDFDWYMVFNLDKMEATKLKVGEDVDVKFPFSQTSELTGKVMRMNISQNDKTAIVIKCNDVDENICSMRNESAQVVVGGSSGLRISNSAIRTNEDGVKGVYVLSGNTVKFKKIDIVYSENDFTLCATSTDSGYLKLYDEVIVEGKGLYNGKIIQ